MATNTYEHAKRELDILVKTVPDPIIGEFIPELLALAEKFGKSGQSGGSAPFTAAALAKAVKQLCLQKTICAITGRDDEWVDVAHLGDGKDPIYQNNREYALFRNGDGKSHYLDAIVWKDEKGHTWTGAAKRKLYGSAFVEYCSRQYVKSFPFVPKTFYVDVISEEVAKDDWEFWIKDPAQLDEVFAYYDEYGPIKKRKHGY